MNRTLQYTNQPSPNSCRLQYVVKELEAPSQVTSLSHKQQQQHTLNICSLPIPRKAKAETGK